MKKPDLRVVENPTVVELHPDTTKKLASLHDRIMNVIYDYADENPDPVTQAEIVGILEYLKADVMRTLK